MGEYLVPVFRRLKVKDYMTRDVVTIRADAPISDAAEKMALSGVGGLPVVDEAGNLVGIVTRSDVFRVPPEERSVKTVESVMSRNLVVTYPEEDLETAFIKMLSHRVERLPVVEPANPRKLFGIIAREDMVRAYKAELAALEQQKPEPPRCATSPSAWVHLGALYRLPPLVDLREDRPLHPLLAHDLLHDGPRPKRYAEVQDALLHVPGEPSEPGLREDDHQLLDPL